MLHKLLKLIAGNDAVTRADLARKLDVSETLVTQMLGELTRMGFLQSTSTDGTGGCSGCPMSQMCAPAPEGEVAPSGWVLTELGRKVAESGPTA
jgi:hypothetical protein